MNDEEKYIEAYKIYSKYNGNVFYMMADNEYEHYKSFKVPCDVENRWEEEFVSTQLKNIVDGSKGVDIVFNLINHLQYTEAIRFLMYYISIFDGDTFSKLLLCERLKTYYDKKKFVNNVDDYEWEGILLFLEFQKKKMNSENIIIDDMYKAKTYLKNMLDEDSIRRRISIL